MRLHLVGFRQLQFVSVKRCGHAQLGIDINQHTIALQAVGHIAIDGHIR